MVDNERRINLVAVGDESAGKSCLLISCCNNEFPTTYVPTIFENYSTEWEVDSRKVQLTLWDTAGQEASDEMRAVAYPNADVFLLCFSLVDKVSLANVQHKWVPDLRHKDSGWKEVPILLVGLKKDLREENPQDAIDVTTNFAFENASSLINLGFGTSLRSDIFFQTEQGIEVANKISAVGYVSIVM